MYLCPSSLASAALDFSRPSRAAPFAAAPELEPSPASPPAQEAPPAAPHFAWISSIIVQTICIPLFDVLREAAKGKGSLTHSEEPAGKISTVHSLGAPLSLRCSRGW